MRAFAVLACLTAFIPPLSPTLAADAAQPDIPIGAFLCDTAAHAIQFADFRSQGESDEIAKDRVGRIAQIEACGRYTGIATLVSESTTVSGGVAYKVTAFRFKRDQRLAWLAETTFAPSHTSWAL